MSKKTYRDGRLDVQLALRREGHPMWSEMWESAGPIDRALAVATVLLSFAALCLATILL